MTPKRKQRLLLVLLLLAGISLAVTFATLALKENMNLFYSTTQITNGEAPVDRTFRLGGMVVDGSVKRKEGDITVQFNLTDTASEVEVRFSGILPDLFREGQGIVAQGKLSNSGIFMASEVLAKHDENYMPPEITESIERAQQLSEQQ